MGNTADMWGRLAALVGRFVDVVRRRRADDDVRGEFEQHIDLLAERYLRLGLSPDEARSKAQQQFGNLLLVREEIYESQRLRWFDDLRQDLRHTFRMLGRSRSFAAVSILSLAVGLGLTTMVFSVGYGVLIRPLPYPDADRLLRLWESHRGAPASVRAPWLSNLTFLAWNERHRTIGRLAAFSDVVVTLDDDSPARMSGARVSPWFFDVMRVPPHLGRFFIDADARGPAVVVLSDELWRNRLHGDPHVIGRTIRIDQRPHTVIGVAAAGFAFPYRDTRLWLPSDVTRGTTPDGAPGIAGIRAVARLVDGMTVAQAVAEGTTAARSQPRPPGARALWGEGGPVDVHARTIADDMTADVRPVLQIFLAGVGCLLLIACANVTNLLRLRGVSREREFTVRAAIGAGRSRVARQLLTETLVITSMGAAVAIVIAAVGIRATQLLAPANLPRLDAIRIDLPAVGFASVVSLAVGILVGLLPAIRAGRLDLTSCLREGVATSPGQHAARFNSILVAGAAAVAVVLVAVAMLLGRSLFHLLSVDPGYDSTDVLVAEVHLPDRPGVDRFTLHAQSEDFRSQLLERLGALPGVTSAGVGNMAPLGTKTRLGRLTVSVPGRNSVTARSRSYVVTPGYAEALRLRLRAGRLLTDADSTIPTQSLLVNDAFVQTFLNGVTPLGFAMDGLLAQGIRAEVVGVVADVRKDGPDEMPEPELYMVPAYPLRHDRDRPLAYEIPRDFSLVVRTTGNPAGVVTPLREIVHELRRDVALDDVTTLEARTTESVRTERFATAIMASFSAVALILAAVGLYTVLSYRISTRMRDIGVRTALGADPRTIAWLVVGDALRLTLPGILVGLGGALLASRLLRALAFGITTYDPVSLGTAPLVLAAVALVATLVPARRAMRVDPLIALRSE